MKKYQPKHIKSNKTAKKIKSFILKTITCLMALVFVISISMLDSEVFYIPLIAMIISGAWLYLIAWANGFTK